MKTAMSAFGALFLCVGTPVVAELDGISAPRMHAVAGDGGCIALIYVENSAGWYHNIETLETPVGDVRVKYETVGGHNPDEPDVVTVGDLPDGVIAQPMWIDLPDGETGEICLLTKLSS